jgi:hypothetical protein
MMSRVILVAAICALVSALPAAAQRPGTVEVGAFARYANLDNSLADNMVGVGGRVAVYLRPTIAFELDVSRTSPDVGATSSTYTPAHFRLVYQAPVSGRVEALVGGGYVRNWYGAPYEASDGGISAILGLRYPLNDMVSLRFDADGDFMIHTADTSPFPFYHGNWSLQVGASVRLNRGTTP